jgi:tRNA1Val (adenine37-N6)-methyltransferase
MVHRPQRLADIMCLARQYKLEPKRIQFVQAASNKKPNLMLLEFRKLGKPELLFLDPIIIYDESGKYTEKVLDIYSKTSIDTGGEQDEQG